jgi:hypothetical protein
MLIIGALNWALEWWNSGQGPRGEVIDKAQRFVQHGLENPSP